MIHFRQKEKKRGGGGSKKERGGGNLRGKTMKCHAHLGRKKGGK